MSRFLVVLNKDENTVSFVDARSGKTEGQVEVDQNPHEVAATADGSRCYVTNSGGNTVAVIDTMAPRVVARITHPLFQFPHGVGLSRNEEELFIAATRSNRVFVVNTSDLEVKEVIATHQRATHMIYLDPERTRIYIPNIGSDNVTVMDAATRLIITHIPVGGGPEGAAVSPDGSHLYVANQKDDNLHVIDLETYETVNMVRLGSCPIRLEFTPDGRYALIPNRESGDLSFVDTARNWEIKRIRTGVWPGGTVVDPEGRYAYVANNKTNDISVIDMGEMVETDRFRAGIHPDGMTYIRLET